MQRDISGMNPAAETTTKYTKNTRIWVSVISCNLVDRWLSLPQQQDKAKAKAAGDLPPPAAFIVPSDDWFDRQECLSYSLRDSAVLFVQRATQPIEVRIERDEPSNALEVRLPTRLL